MKVKVEDLPGGRTVNAWVASNLQLNDESKYWVVGIGLEQPGNPWCLAPVPTDWQLPTAGAD